MSSSSAANREGWLTEELVLYQPLDHFGKLEMSIPSVEGWTSGSTM